MTILQFPPVETADPETGLLAVGGDLEPESLLLAYRNGIFPWPFDEKHLTWFSPEKRAILYLKDIRFSDRFLRKIRSSKDDSGYQFSRNKNFAEVIHQCSIQGERARPEKTWITSDIKQAYIKLHDLGFAESFECSKDGELIGGIYGIRINRFFAGESMFHNQSDGSKLALWHLCSKLQEESIEWIDCQVMNPFLEKMGAIEIPRSSYLEMLKELI